MYICIVVRPTLELNSIAFLNDITRRTVIDFRKAFFIYYIMEIWKEIKGFEDYEVSNLGNVKSLKKRKDLILKKSLDTCGYYHVNLHQNGKNSTLKIHKLVAIAFLNHLPCGYKLVVNHKNFIRTDNRLENLEVVSARENANKKHLKSKSQYVGVTWFESSKKWGARIVINKKRKYLGLFEDEYQAHLAYQKEIEMLKMC